MRDERHVLPSLPTPHGTSRTTSRPGPCGASGPLGSLHIGRSAKSRFGSVVEIGNLNHGKVMNFPVIKREEPQSQRKRFPVVGDRIKLLRMVTSLLDKGMRFAEVRTLLLDGSGKNFESDKVMEGGEYREVGLQDARHISDRGPIHARDFLRIAGSTYLKVMLLCQHTCYCVYLWVGHYSIRTGGDRREGTCVESLEAVLRLENSGQINENCILLTRATISVPVVNDMICIIATTVPLILTVVGTVRLTVLEIRHGSDQSECS
ncbi:hypothetical protein HOY82DRAFT_120142 [Tuber indicum]|nr:hypothetical protein HOY82DRAFT_120142 [Tuber indicum]